MLPNVWQCIVMLCGKCSSRLCCAELWPAGARLQVAAAPMAFQYRLLPGAVHLRRYSRWITSESFNTSLLTPRLWSALRSRADAHCLVELRAVL